MTTPLQETPPCREPEIAGTVPPKNTVETKGAFSKTPSNLKFGVRNYIQTGIFVLTLAVGIQFAVFVYQALGTGTVMVQRPPGVEGFLPIGGLMGWKLYVTTGMWDRIHPAAMVILGYAMIISFAFKKSFCSWFCPVGTLSEWLWKAGAKITGRNFMLPKWGDIPLRALKYALLGFFVYTIWSMHPMGIIRFLQSSYYVLSDVKMLHFFTRMSLATFLVLSLLVVLSMAVKNFWCRYLCPYGALAGLFSILSPTRIQRSIENCTTCGKCTDICPSLIDVHSKNQVLTPECTGCLDCIRVCPAKNTLAFRTFGVKKRSWSLVQVGIVVVAAFLIIVQTAKITDHWYSRVPQAQYQMMLKRMAVQ